MDGCVALGGDDAAKPKPADSIIAPDAKTKLIE
jgi:hypothetical protein